MAESLRILILEDNPADAELVQFELQEAGLVFTAKVVMAKKDFIHELQAFLPDIILSDYDLPDYNGALALAESKKTCPDTPFILVTGAVGEDRAIEILTQGAKDYVLKSRLEQRLGPAVRRALAEADEHKERKKTEEELKASSLYSRILIEASLDPLVTISPDGKVMDVNKATEEITGVSREQIIGKDFSDYFTEPEKAREGYQKAFLEGSVKDYSLSIRHISGSMTQVLYNATVYKNENGEVQGVFAAARDVTELKKAETELREAHGNLDEQVKIRTAELEATISSMATGLIVYNMAGKAIRMNDTAKKLLPQEIFFNKTIDERARIIRWETEKGLPFPPEEIPVARALQGETSRNMILAATFPDHKLWISASAAPIRSKDGRMLGVVASFIDITESKHAEALLQDSEKRYRRLFEAAKDGILILDANTGMVDDVNSFLLQLLGYSYDELRGKHIWELGLFKDIAASREAFKILQDNEYIRYEDLPLKTRDGKSIAVEFVSNVYLVDHHKVIQCNIRDITEHKQVTEEKNRIHNNLQKEKDRLQALINGISDEIWFADTRKQFTLANPSALHEFGLNSDATAIDIQKFAVSLEVYRPDGSARPVEEAPPLRALAGEVVKDQEEMVRTPVTGEIRHRLVSSNPVRDAGGQIIGSVSVVRDITGRRQMEDLMRESETRFRTMANSIPQLAWIARADGFITWYNQRWHDYTGTTPEQMEGWGWQSVHDPKVLPEVMAKWKTAIATGEPFDMEFPLLGADKIFRPFLTRIQPLKDEQGHVIQWFGTNTDLSEYKRAEEELALNEREFRLLAESMPQIVWTTRVDGWNTYFNQRWVDYTGLTLEESYGHGWNKPFHPDDQQRAWDAWQNAVLHNSPYLLQCRLRRADGIYRWWLIHGVPVLDENGNTIKWYGTCTDINDMKQAEEAMLQSHNQFNLLIKNIRSGVALIDGTGKFTVVNPTFLRMFGLKDDETINNVNDRNWNDWQVFESDGTLLHLDEHPVRKAAITGKPVRDKLVGVRLPSGGDLIWMLISADLMRRPDGNIQSTICTYHDITERKRAEEALRDNELFLRETENVARLGGWKANPESNFLMWTEGVYRIVEAPLYYNPDIIDGMKFYIPKYRPILHERLLHTLATNEPFAEECEIITMSGRHVWVEVRGLSAEREGAATYVMGTIQDISDRKIRENEREKYNHALQALSRSSQAMMRSTDEYKYMEEICKIIVEDCGYTMVWIGFAEDNEDKTVRPIAISGFEEGYIDTLKITWADTERGRGPTGTAIRTGKPATCRNMLTDPRFEPWRKEAIKRGYASSIVLPLMAGSKAIGALTIYSKDPDSFTGYEEKLLAELANDLSYGISAIRLREALRESEVRLQAITANTPDHILMQDNDLRYQLVINPQIGLTENNMLGKTDYDILEQEDADKLTAIKRKVLETGESVSLETSLINSRGEPEYFEGAYVPKLGHQGQTDGVIGYFRNVTERKKIEEAILRAKDEWERTFDTVPDLIAILDKEHRIVRVNKAMAQRLRLTPDQCIGLKCYEAVHGLSCPPEFCPHALTCRDGGEHVAEVNEAILGGDFMVSTTPLCDHAGQLVGSVHVARDITRRKAAEDELVKQAAQLQERSAQLEEINSELESFSYSVSHDLRAPLRAIDGFSRIILRREGEQFDEKTKHQFNMIRDNIKLMGVLIENLLSFSRVQKTSMSISEINMDKLAGEVWKEIKAANEEQKIELKMKKIKPGYGDHTLIRQVLFNLLSNAVKFTKNKKQGVIEMSSYADDGKTVYCIKDNGAGFDMAHYDKLFGVFQRLHSSEEYEGTGIGLAIVQRIVSRHGGRVWAEGKVEKGATFCFTLNSIPLDGAPQRRRKKRDS